MTHIFKDQVQMKGMNLLI